MRISRFVLVIDLSMTCLEKRIILKIIKGLASLVPTTERLLIKLNIIIPTMYA